FHGRSAVLAVERALSRQLHADYAHPLCADLFDVRDNLAYVTQTVCVVILAVHLSALMVHPDHGEVEPLVSRYLAQCRKTVNRRAVAYDNPLRLSFQNSILPPARVCWPSRGMLPVQQHYVEVRSEEHTSELQSRFDLVCRLLLEKKKRNN